MTNRKNTEIDDLVPSGCFIEPETGVFASMMVDESILTTLTPYFDKRWFSNEKLSNLCQLVLAFYKKFKRIPALVELTKILSNKPEYCDIISNVSTMISSVNPEVIIDSAQTFVKKRAALLSILDCSKDLSTNPECTTEKILQKISKINEINFSEQNGLGMEYFDEEALARHFDVLKNPESRIPTLFPLLDKYTHGGILQNKSLYVIMAQAGLGKSLMLSNLAVNFLKQNKTVVVISLEMSEDVYASRFDAHISNMDINALGRNETTVLSRISGFKKLYPDAKLFIKDYPPRTISTTQIERFLTQIIKIKGIKPDVLIVDYLNLVRPEITTDNMYQDGICVSERLRSLSYKFDLPVVTATQVNTAGMNNESLGMENISESRGIAHTADFILALFQTDEDRDDGIINGKIIKNRLGGDLGKIIPLSLNPETLVLSELSDCCEETTLTSKKDGVLEKNTETTTEKSELNEVVNLLDMF